jgi:hypothetical protein
MRKSPRYASTSSSPAEIEEMILAYCKQKARPVTIGEVSSHLGWWAQLDWVESLMDELCLAGKLNRQQNEGVLTFTRCTTPDTK